MLNHVLNQKATPQPKKNPRHKPTQENPAQRHKNAHAHKTTRTKQNKAVSTQQPSKTPCTNTAPPTHHPMVAQDQPKQTRPHLPRQHKIIFPSTQQPSLRALKKIPLCRHKKQGRTHPNQSCVYHQTANGRHRADTENPRKLQRRHSPAPTGPHHRVHTKTPTCPHRAPPRASLCQAFPFSRESHPLVENTF